MPYSLQLLGGFRLFDYNGRPLVLPSLARALLSLLAVTSSPMQRRQLAEMLSASGTEHKQRARLRQAIYLTRKSLADDAVISARDGSVVLNDAVVKADVRLFRCALARADEPALTELVELYRGPFLDGEKSPSLVFEEWLARTRAEFLENALGTLLKLAESGTATGQYARALMHARRATELDPLREDAHRWVMRCLIAMGRRTAALRQYDVVRELLVEELGIPPEAETEAVLKTTACGEDGRAGTDSCMMVAPIASDEVAKQRRGPSRPGYLPNWRASIAAALVASAILAGIPAVRLLQFQSKAPVVPSVAILPFASTSADPSQDYLGRGVVQELTAVLSTYPGLRVISRKNKLTADKTANAGLLGQELSAQYLLEGSVRRSAQFLHVTAQLIDTASGEHVWARQFEAEGSDIGVIQEKIAARIFEALVGFSGAIESEEQRQAWRKPGISLDERDYVLRGEQFYFQFTRQAHARARQIWREGLAIFPGSARLRLHLAMAYRHAAEAGWSKNSRRDLKLAWQLGSEASLAAHGSRFEQWSSHWAMAKLAQWCKQDFERSIVEARIAIKMVPYDASSRADLAELMANAGKVDEAIEWLQEAKRRDPKGPEWYSANLAWAYYLAGRYEDALAELHNLNKPRRLLLAALHVKLGRLQQARTDMSEFLKSHPHYTRVDAELRPLIPSLKRSWLEDLRNAGLPDV